MAPEDVARGGGGLGDGGLGGGGLGDGGLGGGGLGDGGLGGGGLGGGGLGGGGGYTHRGDESGPDVDATHAEDGPSLPEPPERRRWDVSQAFAHSNMDGAESSDTAFQLEMSWLNDVAP